MKTRHYLWRLLCYSPWLCLGSLILSLACYNLPLLVGLIMREFFNALTEEASVSFDVQTLIVFFVATQLISLMSDQGYAAIYVYFEKKLKVLLQVNLLQNILESPSVRNTQSSGEMINRFDDDADGIVTPLTTAIEVGGHIISAFVALYVLLHINSFITLFAFLPMIVIILITNWMGRRIENYRRVNRETTGRVTGFLGELLGASHAIKVAATEGPAVIRFDALSEARRAAVLDSLFNQLLNSMNATTINLATGIILILAGQSMRAGTFTVGDFALFISYIAIGEVSVSGCAQWMGQLLAGIKQASVSLLRFLELIPDAPRDVWSSVDQCIFVVPFPTCLISIKTDEHHFQVLQAEGLSYRHPGTGRGIEGINFRMERGDFVVITGRIGAGKTMLLEALLGLVRAGAVKFAGTG